MTQLCVNCVKIDFSPYPYNQDLCIGSVTKRCKLFKKGCIRLNGLTVKVTRACVLQLFVNSRFKKKLHLVEDIVELIRLYLNRYKKTNVITFKSTINNINASGTFFNLHKERINSSYFDQHSFDLRGSTDVQESSNLFSPFVGDLPIGYKIVVIEKRDNFFLKINLISSTYVIIAKTLIAFQSAKRIVTDVLEHPLKNGID